MSSGTPPRIGTGAYRSLLERLDHWFERPARAPG